MAMYLTDIPPSTIKLNGTWPSEVFMDYIHPQIAKFSSLVSKSMVTHHTFFTIQNNNRSLLPSLIDHQQNHGLILSLMTLNPIVLSQ
jgi:hypothetical protein